jgi:AAA+ superfamily predicted ATPase
MKITQYGLIALASMYMSQQVMCLDIPNLNVDVAHFNIDGDGIAKGLGKAFSEAIQNMPPLTMHIDELPDMQTVHTFKVDGLADQFGKAAGDAVDSMFSRGKASTFQNLKNLDDLFNEMNQTLSRGINSGFNVRNALQIAGPIALGIATIITGYYGTKFVWACANQAVLNPKPTILLPGAKIGRWDRVKRFWNGYKSPAMIFTEAVKERLNEIVEKTKIIKQQIQNGIKITYDNLLLYGEPGTGKTLFATILADLTNMDFAPTTAAALLQKDAGVKYLNELMDMAKKSKYGVLIFIDEADAMFVDRNTLSPDSDHYKVLNHLLALTGDGSNKFMLVAATNHAYVMDEAMGRRFQDRLCMPLPDEVTRKGLVDLYAQTALFNEKENGKEFVTAAKGIMTQATVETIVQRTAGLSNAEIKDIMQALRKKALVSTGGLLTMAVLESAVTQGVEKRRVAEEDKKKRQQRFGGIQEELAASIA